MSAHPERLVLGGQRRDLTIMFTDIAEFTNLSEQLSPEQVSHLLNTHLSAMTDIIMKYGGTVDKFIGDAIMAFWNAPLDDEEHAMHACQAARDMMGAMQTLREQFVQEGLPVVHMRVGMHSGAAVVGNMGSDKRFDYTAIGDNVNLASRLEGINKLYGTEVILSSSTAGIVGNRIPLQVLDKVRVKGKTRAVEIFTFASDQPIPVSEAVEATRGRDWDRAEVLWQKIVQQPDFETLARLYLQRISEYRVNPPPTDWDGSVALEKM
jgi:adenylate cyclase